jgi:hypothetical protein
MNRTRAGVGSTWMGANVGAALEEMGGEAAAERMHGHQLAEPGHGARCATSPLQHAGVAVPGFCSGQERASAGAAPPAWAPFNHRSAARPVLVRSRYADEGRSTV